MWNKIKVNSFIKVFAASNQPLWVGTAFSGWLPTFGDGGACVNSGQIIGLFFCLDQADQFCQYQTSHINILTSTKASIFDIYEKLKSFECNKINFFGNKSLTIK